MGDGRMSKQCERLSKMASEAIQCGNWHTNIFMGSFPGVTLRSPGQPNDLFSVICVC